MRYHVPQFIEVEDKIFGPLTFKQFLYMAGGIGLGYLLYRLLPGFIGLPLGVVAIGFGFALAFFKYNIRPFIHFIEAAFRYMNSSKLYVWKKVPKKRSELNEDTSEAAAMLLPRLSGSKLKDVALDLDVRTGEEEEESEPLSKEEINRQRIRVAKGG
jgi:hypothetical protein